MTQREQAWEAAREAWKLATAADEAAVRTVERMAAKGSGEASWDRVVAKGSAVASWDRVVAAWTRAAAAWERTAMMWDRAEAAAEAWPKEQWQDIARAWASIAREECEWSHAAKVAAETMAKAEKHKPSTLGDMEAEE